MVEAEPELGSSEKLPAIAYGNMIGQMLGRILDLPSSVLGNPSYMTEGPDPKRLLQVPSPSELKGIFAQGLQAFELYQSNMQQICTLQQNSPYDAVEREREIAEAADVFREATIKVAGRTMKAFPQHDSVKREILDHLQALDFLVRKEVNLSPEIEARTPEFV